MFGTAKQHQRIRGNLTRKRKPSEFAIYKQNVYRANEFLRLQQFANRLSTKDMVDDAKASGRRMYVVPESHPILHVVYNKRFVDTVRTLTGNRNLRPCWTIPVEYRTYETGSYMDWHNDTQMLPDQLQYECVVTLTNTSDSETLLEYPKTIKTLQTKPNSLLIVRANGIRHKVTPVQTGVRTILKLVFCE
jgi:hypothetical protein